MDELKKRNEIQKRVKSKLAALFAKYNVDYSGLEDALKWKPIVLVIGNYSSGKSTLINEFLGRETQRTGQAPTDDSFTVITAPESGDEERIIPGSTLVNDDRLPFAGLKKYGEQLVAHFRMKALDIPFLKDMAVIDTPGMLDSVTEKDRGYDYMKVIGELARLADLIVLMFDPHKAGTIKETYKTIRNTLPESAGEDRIVFVMSRIDECDNLSDLVRAYGTLCWNLSQMTGRKDIPRIFLTYSPEMAENTVDLAVWAEERMELKRRMLSAPSFRVSHILHAIDNQINELRMIVEAMVRYSLEGRTVLAKVLRVSMVGGLAAFFFMDTVLKELTGFPEQTFLSALLGRAVQPSHLSLPFLGFGAILGIGILFYMKVLFPRFVKKSVLEPETFVDLGTAYRQHVWSRCRQTFADLVEKKGAGWFWAGHNQSLSKIDRFVNRDLQEFYKSTR